MNGLDTTGPSLQDCPIRQNLAIRKSAGILQVTASGVNHSYPQHRDQLGISWHSLYLSTRWVQSLFQERITSIMPIASTLKHSWSKAVRRISGSVSAGHDFILHSPRKQLEAYAGFYSPALPRLCLHAALDAKVSTKVVIPEDASNLDSLTLPTSITYTTSSLVWQWKWKFVNSHVTISLILYHKQYAHIILVSAT